MARLDNPFIRINQLNEGRLCTDDDCLQIYGICTKEEALES